MADRIPLKRCAIYVRKSSDEGLDMSYNSLEAQADACAAYIASQRHEGWTKLPKVYEDGGYSGGNMERPGLQNLLADIAAGKIDIIVVYKIDRLTRSLTDFAKLNDLLDRHNVSFVAVTQQFNTSTSMGRLTLNVLLSFAQFEREVAGERIRDKVAASKKKGMWMGGPVPLGYAVKERKLVVVEPEAAVVRRMFERYLELKSVQLLQQELEQQGVRSRLRTTSNGRTLGGFVLGRGAIAHMLKNPLYIGMIRAKGELYQGQHEAIIPRELFEALQSALAGQSPGEAASVKSPMGALLKGIAVDGNGNRLIPNYCKKNGIQYHYYTSAKRLRSVGADPAGIRVPAGDLERIIVAAVAERLRNERQMHQWLSNMAQPTDLAILLSRCELLAEIATSQNPEQMTTVRKVIEHVQVSKTAIVIRLSAEGLQKELRITGFEQSSSQSPPIETFADQTHPALEHPAQSDPMTITITSHLLRCGKQMKLVVGHAPEEASAADPQLVEMVTKTRRWFYGLISGRYSTLRTIADEEQCDKSYVSRLLSVAFLSPDLVERILTGSHPATLTSERLRKACPLPMRWEEQRAALID